MGWCMYNIYYTIVVRVLIGHESFLGRAHGTYCNIDVLCFLCLWSLLHDRRWCSDGLVENLLGEITMCWKVLICNIVYVISLFINLSIAIFLFIYFIIIFYLCSWDSPGSIVYCPVIECLCSFSVSVWSPVSLPFCTTARSWTALLTWSFIVSYFCLVLSLL